MRHGKKNPKLGRTSSHRRLMLSNMSCSLIKHKRITTTLTKAKALQRYIEPLVTKSKKNTMHSRRMVFSYLRNKYGVSELFDTISSKISNREGGYTRIIKLGKRLGDNAEMCIIEFVDYNEIYTKDVKSKSKKRTRRSKKASSEVNDSNLEKSSKKDSSSEENPAVEEAPAAGEAPAAEEAPAKEETPVTEEAPAKEETPGTEEASADEVNSAEEASTEDNTKE
ncbi:MAG: 50S ribosomal protein L17 [Flavobacteriales bacterium]|nr:50S ribosomal protein L17 [Flavobacteriales bacterium]